MKSPGKILIINIFGIGDVLFTTPLLANLKLALPDISLGYLCNRRTAPLFEYDTRVDKIYIYERDEFAEISRRSKVEYLRKWLDFWRGIQKEGYEAVFDLSLNTAVNFFTWKIGIPQRIGYNYKKRSPFLNQALTLRGYEEKHVIEYYLDLLQFLDVPVRVRKPELAVAEKDQIWADQFFAENGLESGKPVIGIVPGGGSSWGKDANFKRWAPECFSKLADKFVENFNAQIILMGSREEIPLCGKVSKEMDHSGRSLYGETTISQFAALARKCSLNIVNDGGPLHVAASAGARTLSIFGPVSEHIYGPYPREGHIVVAKNIPCRPCYRQFRRAGCEHISCLRDITVEEVLGKAEKIMESQVA